MAVLIIRLEIEGGADHALEVLSNMLDNGDPQDQINDHDCAEDACSQAESPSRLRVIDAQVKIEET